MKPVDKPHLIVAALSHPGEQRDHNEDRYSVTAYRLERDRRPALLAVVADGIGGHQAGEVAAELAIEATVERVGSSSGRDPIPTLRAAVEDAARAVIDASHQQEAQQGMGSTLSVAWIVGDQLYLTYVGDSRIYWLREGRIRQLSNDHTWVQEALDHEIISPEEAVDHPHSHVLRRHIGGEELPEPDLRIRLSGGAQDAGSPQHQGLRLQPGDQLLLCSDGLTDLVEAEEIGDQLLSRNPTQAAQQLVQMARERGGHDNITVVALKVPPDGIKMPRTGWMRWGILGILLTVALAAVVALAVGWRLNLWPWDRLGLGYDSAEPAVAEPTALPMEAQETADGSGAFPTATVTPTPAPTSTAVPLATVPSDGP